MGRRQFRKMAHLSFVRSKFEPNIFALNVAELAQRLRRQLAETLPTGSSTHQDANSCHVRLLRARHKRPSGDPAAEKRDELASSDDGHGSALLLLGGPTRSQSATARSASPLSSPK